MIFLSKIGGFVWMGIWMGFGYEVSFFLFWVGWRVFHNKVAHKLDPEHFFHTIHEYFK